MAGYNKLSLKLFLILFIVGIVVITSSVLVLYNIAVDNMSDRVNTMSASYSRIINSVASFDISYSDEQDIQIIKDGVFDQILSAELNDHGFGVSGEYVLGKMIEDQIHFLMPSRLTKGFPAPVNRRSESAKPMQKALLGTSGVIRAPDYSGNPVIAGYQPLPDLQAGFVAKINLLEVGKPYWRFYFISLAYVFIISLAVAILYGTIINRNSGKNKNRERSNLSGLILSLLFISLSSTILLTGMLYNHSLETQKSQLISLNRGIVSLIESIALFDQSHYDAQFNDSENNTTILQILDAMRLDPGFEKSGEFVMGRYSNDSIEFILSSRFTGEPAASVPIKGTAAEPMRRALAGESGLITNLDYRNETVYAAFHPIEILNVGFVTKIDLKDIQRPFWITGYISLSFAIFSIVFGILLAPKIMSEESENTAGDIFGSLVKPMLSSAKENIKDGNTRLLAASLVLVFLTILDVLTPLGIASGTPYLLLVVTGAWILGKRGLLVLGGISSILVIAGLLFSPVGEVLFWNAFVNRLFVLFTLWFVVLILLRNKEAEHSLRQSEGQIFQLIDSAPDAMIVVDTEGQIRMVNRQGEFLFGYTRETLIGNPIEKLIPQSLADRHKKHRNNYINNPHSRPMGRNLELMAIDKGNRVFPVDINLSPIKTDKRLLVVAAVRDITLQKKLEQDLTDAKMNAEAATRAKSDFLANMSHEIRTPMNAIIGLSHLIQKTELSRKQDDYVQKISGSAHNLLGIINDILDFSKIEAGKLAMENIDFNLHDVFENLGSMIGHKTRDKGLELIFKIDTSIPPDLKGDPLRLGQILLNLANNAVKFTEEGEILISVEELGRSEEDIELKFYVRDSGVGLTKEQAGKLFQAFTQADTSTTRKFGGTGLGLSISKKLTEMMGGSIGVDSTFGEGSIFYFTALFQYKSELKKKSIVPEELRSLNVLIVDDNAVSLDVLTSYIEDFSFKAIAVDSGMEAIKAIRHRKDENSKPFDLILMDYMMPQMNGYETAAKINEMLLPEERPRYLLVTSYSRDEILSGVDTFGFDGFILKPVNQSLLFNTIVEAFGYEQDKSMKNTRFATPEGFNRIRGARILLAEDNLINQQVATELLETEGFFIDLANNGREAVNMSDKGDYDLVLMDLQMPVLDGYDATKEIRKKNYLAELPIIAMTADAMTGVRDQVMEAGMNGYITKPVDTSQLWNTLVKWIKQGDRKLPESYKPEDPKSGSALAEILIPEIDGIDRESGLTRVGYNKELYLKLLNQFKNEYTDFKSDINRLLAEGSNEKAIRLAHSLKGVSANLGAGEIQHKAALLEKAIKENLSIESTLESTSISLNSIIEDLKMKLTAEHPQHNGNKEISEVQLREKLQDLHEVLKKRKPKQANDILEELETFRLSSEILECIITTRAALDKYDMKGARSLIESYLDKLI